MFLFWCFYFLLFYFSADGCMYMTISGCVCACVCKWLILYIWCSLMETWTMSHFDFSFLSSTLWTLHSTCGCSENYAREWFSDCWMWFYWERSSVDWLFVRVNNKKKRPYYLIFCCQTFEADIGVEPWFVGEKHRLFVDEWELLLVLFCFWLM